MCNKIGKKKSLMYSFLVGIVTLPFTLIGLIEMDSFLLFGIIFVVGLAMCLAGWFLLPGVIYADIAEDDQKQTGVLKAGIYTGFPSIMLNIFQALGLFLLGVILNLPNNIGYVLWGPISSVLLIITYLYTRKFLKVDFDWEKKN